VRVFWVSIRASVVASKVFYVQYVKQNRRMLTLANYTQDLNWVEKSCMAACPDLNFFS